MLFFTGGHFLNQGIYLRNKKRNSVFYIKVKTLGRGFALEFKTEGRRPEVLNSNAKPSPCVLSCLKYQPSHKSIVLMQNGHKYELKI